MHLKVKIKIWPMALWGALGLTLGAITGIIIWNVLKRQSLLLADLIMYLIIGITLGVFLGSGIYRNTKERETNLKFIKI